MNPLKFLKRTRLYLTCILLILCMIIVQGILVYAGQKGTLKEGDTFPETVFALPPSPQDQAYLGIGKQEKFSIQDIQGEVLLVEVMNINCSSCQRQAPVDNRLFSLIESTKTASGRIKMLAIAVGARYKDIKDFRDYFKTPYPVIADPNFILYDDIGGGAVPLSIFLVRRKNGMFGTVAHTHVGSKSQHEDTFKKLQSLLSLSPATIQKAEKDIKEQPDRVAPVLSERELENKIIAAFNELGTALTVFEKIQIDPIGTIYTGMVQGPNRKTRVFAVPVSRRLPCDVCHDAHFIYIFDEAGKILSFIPIKLWKYGNELWDEEDIEWARKRIVGQNVFLPVAFDAEVDAVSSATITSSVIYNSLQKGEKIVRVLQEKGLIKASPETTLSTGEKERTDVK